MLGRRLTWLAAVIPAITMAVATCDDEAPPRTGSTGTESTPGILGESVCPEAAPAPGDRCVLPEGTTCSFGACGSAIAQCSLGRWRFGGNPPTRAVCPSDFPVPGEACPPCFSAEAVCIYGSTDCTAPDSANQSRARCANGVWTIETRPCGEGGANVQHDAAADSG